MSEDTGYPRAWKFNEDGLVCEGRHVRFELVELGEQKNITHVLSIADEERAIWITNWDVLRDDVRKEVELRPAGDFNLGELIRYGRSAGKTESANGRGYYKWDFWTEHGDQYRPKGAAVFRAADAAMIRAEAEDAEALDASAEKDPDADNIPF